ncbi:conserved hypothetical protein (plasmid) [Borreliella spielmanii A14S]|uniref:Uncharacterized protein n=1 Tax=Borreliella spielmanii A14S TaxID=498742 RepID=C0RBR7_9SPIR|nr:conserved hypothetical protein [Borreliella spielmanii A14S]
MTQQKINRAYIDKEYKDLITVQILKMKSLYDKMVATFKLFSILFRSYFLRSIYKI